uniref:Uncharacterized mitochondrial protein AtMg00810-like n=1 Tax=Nicotiana tabacum TaxID=4097 RepID=A0A1S4BXJ0_TOBAC|nr:PREDICTED: uncharacterized mitochondrial protein AtMg00810-like [Nicotiana tabacum]
MKDLGELKYFLGIEFARSADEIIMHKRKYVLEIISELRLGAAKPVATPLEVNAKLTTKEYDDHLGTSSNVQPKRSHMDATLRVVKYVKNHPGQGILMSNKTTGTLEAFCDADWVACQHSRTSVTSFLIKLGGSLVSWKSKKQTTISRCFTEAEYRSLAVTIAKLVFLVGLIKEIGVDVQLPVNIHCYSKAAIQISANPDFKNEQNILI